MKKQQPYIANEVSAELLEKWHIKPGMKPDEVKCIISQKFQPEEHDAAVILGCTFAGYQTVKQAYRFHPELITDLLSNTNMNFKLVDLHIPFFSLYFDIHDSNIELDNGKILGIFTHITEPPHFYLFLVAIVQDQTGRKRLVKASVDYDNKKTVKDSIDQICGEMDGDVMLCNLTFSMLAYISSEKPDVKDTGKSIFFRKNSKQKPVPDSVRKWEVGYRYVKESLTSHPNLHDIHPNTLDNTKTHASPRSHIRKGHWHTYLCGPGRTERKVVWVKDCKVGKQDITDVIRVIDTESN